NIFASQLRELCEDLVFRPPTRQVPEDIPHGDPSSTDTGLAEPNIRGDRDALQRAHTPNLRQSLRGGKTCFSSSLSSSSPARCQPRRLMIAPAADGCKPC